MMRFRVVHHGHWKVVALLDRRGRCELLEALDELAENPKTRATAAGLSAWWSQISPEGPRASLSEMVYHSVDAKNKIYEFIKADHRVLCFEEEGKLVICSHLMRKKKQKTPKEDVAQAVRLKKDYLSAKERNAVVIVGE